MKSSTTAIASRFVPFGIDIVIVGLHRFFQSCFQSSTMFSILFFMWWLMVLRGQLNITFMADPSTWEPAQYIQSLYTTMELIGCLLILQLLVGALISIFDSTDTSNSW